MLLDTKVYDLLNKLLRSFARELHCPSLEQSLVSKESQHDECFVRDVPLRSDFHQFGIGK